LNNVDCHATSTTAVTDCDTDEFHETGLPEKGTYGKPTWFDSVRSEYWACRQGVGLIDMSTFTKFELRV